MQIANGILVLSPENVQHVRGVTPAEVLILHAMHFQYAKGTPLGDFYIQEGVAETVDVEGKPATEEEYNPGTGKTIPARAAIPAKTHKRTNAEECARLRRKYTGNISKNGQSKPAFEAVFGGNPVVKLPETFDEIGEFVGHTEEQPIFKSLDAAPKDDLIRTRRQALIALGRADVVTLAISKKLKVHAGDSVEEIVGAIIAKEATEAEAAEGK